ncbi:MAG: DUF934 domain-containing protein [Myxococcota bacterium]|nr:DUF934 domain-containing protein [Myxococcota bacterium]
MALIKHRQLVDDHWQVAQTTSPPADKAAVCVPWTVFVEHHANWLDWHGEVGVRVPGDIEPAELAPYVDRLALINIEFPKFTDGRGYSLARLLRTRYGFLGELRASGDILRDQLLYLTRCGFDAFELKADKDAAGALEAFEELPIRYQQAGDGHVPPWKSRKNNDS